MPGFLLKIRQDSARIFTKLSPAEELGTLETNFLPKSRRQIQKQEFWNQHSSRDLSQNTENRDPDQQIGTQKVKKVPIGT